MFSLRTLAALGLASILTTAVTKGQSPRKNFKQTLTRLIPVYKPIFVNMQELRSRPIIIIFFKGGRGKGRITKRVRSLELA